MEKPILSKKQATGITIIALILLLSSPVIMIVSGILKDHGYGEFWWPLVGLVGCLTLDLASLALLIIFRKDIIHHEVEAKEKKIDTLPLQNMKGLFPDSIQPRFLEHRFKDVGDGFLRKKVFSALKDSVCYYVKCTDSSSLKDVFEQTMDNVLNRNESGSVCLLLFVSKKDIQASDLEYIRSISKTYVLAEASMPMPV